MKERIENVRQFLKVASSPAIIQWQAITGVAVLSILIHLLASIDLGFEELLPRIIFAGISVVPMFVLITLCLSVKIAAENMFLAFYVLAISVGGVIRGAIIESGLSFLNIESNAIADFRLFAGVVISLIITLTVGYSWATIQSTQSVLTKLRVENEQLTLALSKLEEESRAEESRRVIDLLEHVKNKVESIDSQPRSVQIEELEKIINGFIRPVSKNWALNLGEYAPQYSRTPSVTLRGVWSSLDPTKHLPSPMLSIWIIILSALAAAVGTFGIDVAQQLAITLGVVLFVTLPPGFAFVKRVLGGERSLTKDVLLTVSLVVMTIPTLVATTFVLRNTSNPTAFVLPGLVTVPLLGWILMVGRAALYQSQVIIEELNAIQHRLRWSIA
ncbi:MAG: hypothetical protein RIS09_1097, partial [Actinomycetota bacterium]